MGSRPSTVLATVIGITVLAACGGTERESASTTTSTTGIPVTTSTAPAGTPGSATLHLSTPFILSGTGTVAVTCRVSAGRTAVTVPEVDTAAGVRVAADFSYAADGSTGTGRITITLPSGIVYPIDVTRPVTVDGAGRMVVFDTTVQTARVQGDLQWGCSP